MVWEAQVVIKESSMRSRPHEPGRRIGDVGGCWKERLYALRRRFVVVVDANAVALKVLGSSRPWWSTSTPRQLVVKKRLVKIVNQDSESIMIRLADEAKAAEFVLAVSSELGVDPIMSVAAESDTSGQQRELEQMAALFLTSPEFRQRVQQIHQGLERIWGMR